MNDTIKKYPSIKHQNPFNKVHRFPYNALLLPDALLMFCPVHF